MLDDATGGGAFAEDDLVVEPEAEDGLGGGDVAAGVATEVEDDVCGATLVDLLGGFAGEAARVGVEAGDREDGGVAVKVEFDAGVVDALADDIDFYFFAVAEEDDSN